eukprot:TRINITY_DN1330_c0_g1_i1.p1 TRINITY_DN1330_c0_g1~~TRINITY_DN1330_c0_g1_i1.p1  ORF type:complete len:130 (+),score=22.84 TRINITY_DN1330_c0_g1_i1:37-426(+)
MSTGWQQFVDVQIIQASQPNCDAGAIFGLDGVEWAKTASWSVSSGEMKALIAAFNDATTAHQSGLTLGGTQYYVVVAGPKTIYGACPGGGFCSTKTAKAIIVGRFKDNIGCGTAVSLYKLADYLTDTGF